MSNEFDVKELTDRYMAQWNEPDAATRSKLIRDLWAVDGIQVLVDPPEEIREAAANLSFPVPPLEVRGHDAMEARVTRAYEMFIEPGHSFVPAGEVSILLANVVAVGWSMVTADGGVVGGGMDVLAIDDDGKIRTDHQFIGAV
ncbi:hypothetical protein J4573_17815 [Actinomadura barringtoniae]|uniref:Nuclear transport factor 2 family protein n=1 Tax=Actinomadura barringtoniae TaxID=1427535 RepID=A0A939PFV0_9ACTN|nr:hypothetical protein [Actinomadura barringtoniae]MBO2448964.1 hypothetical protein [Actinomadura barringtoniae]